jgi:hypothetical protein
MKPQDAIDILLEARTAYQVANSISDDLFGEFLFDCSDDELDHILRRSLADELAQLEFGRDDFADLDEKEMEILLNEHPFILRGMPLKPNLPMYRF